MPREPSLLWRSITIAMPPVPPTRQESSHHCIVERDYNAFMDEDPMGPSGVETMMCDLEIIVDLPEGQCKHYAWSC